MRQFIDFGLQHWELCLAFLMILGLMLVLELHVRLSAAPGLSAQQAVFLMNRENAIFLDMRDTASFAKGHVANSVNLPFSELTTKLEKLDKYRQSPIIINFSQGQAHHKVAKILKRAGFSKLYHLKGGIVSWQNASLPLAKR